MGNPYRPRRPLDVRDETPDGSPEYDDPSDGLFTDMFHSLRVPLLRLARVLLADQMDAEDLVQDVMVELWSHRHRFDPGRGSPAAWASAILRHRAVDRVRTSRARTTREQRYAAISLTPLYDQVLEIVEQRSDAETVRRLIPDLPAAQGQAVALVYYRGLTLQQAADAAGVSRPALAARLRAARQHLGEAMNDHE